MHLKLRTGKGNMMMIMIMIAGVIIVAVLVVMTVHFVFFAEKRVQGESDDIALRLARQLNQNDNAGFLNNIVSYSRESVFNSRKTYNSIKERAEQLEPLARQLSTDAREGAVLVEQERQALSRHTLAELRKSIEDAAKEGRASVTLPWASYAQPEIKTVEIGYIKDVESNVASPTGNDELLAFDKSAGNLTNADFYKANRNLSLPDADSDLTFKLSSLPAPIKDTISPPRLAGPKAFKMEYDLVKDGKFVSPTPQYLPSAARIGVVSTVKVSIGKENQSTVPVWSTGVACGASPPP